MTRLFAGIIPFLATLATASPLQEVARLDQAPGNITVSACGRIFMSLHQFYEPRWRAAELLPNGQLRPFPDEQWALGVDENVGLDAVLGIQSDRSGVVWMLDNGLRNATTPSLVAWDTMEERHLRTIELKPPITVEQSFVNDLAVDESHQAIYIADPAPGNQAALIVVDLTTGQARRVLQGHRSVVAEDIDLIIDGRPVQIKQDDGTRLRPRIGVNPIALDGQNRWLYFGPMHGRTLYRVATSDLLDDSLSAQALAKRVEPYSGKPICDGISVDNVGNIYISDIANNAIGVITTDRRYRILVQDPRLSWPDAFSFGADDMLYTVSNQLHKSARLNTGEMEAAPPYFVFRLKPLASGTAGR